MKKKYMIKINSRFNVWTNKLSSFTWLCLFQEASWLLRCKSPSSGVHRVSNSLNCKQSRTVLSHFSPPPPASFQRGIITLAAEITLIFFFLRERKLWRWGLICNAAKAQISSEVPPLGRQTRRDQFVPLCLLCIPARSRSSALVACVPSDPCLSPNTTAIARVVLLQSAVPRDNPVIKSCGFCVMSPCVVA